MSSRSYLRRTIAGIETELVIQYYADRILVLVTQLGKIGNLTQVSLPSTTPLNPIDFSNENLIIMPPPAISLKAILGSTTNETESTLNALYATHIATLMWSLMEQNRIENRRDIIIGLALKSSVSAQDDTTLNAEAKDTFKAVMAMVVELQNNERLQ